MNLDFENIFDVVVDDKIEAEKLKAYFDLMIVVRDVFYIKLDEMKCLDVVDCELNISINYNELDIFKICALLSWEDYTKTGQHLTGSEVRDWLNKLGTCSESELP